VGVVTVHEPPYVEGGGDRSDLSVPDEQLDVVRRVRDLVDRLIVVVVSGRPLLLGSVLEEADGIADVLLGRAPATGRLPVAWPRTEAHVRGAAGSAADPPPWPVGHRSNIRTSSATNRR
jgi:beta-glucosidase